MEGLERIIGMIIDGESSEYLDVPIWKKNIIISPSPEIILYCEGFYQMRICSDIEEKKIMV